MPTYDEDMPLSFASSDSAEDDGERRYRTLHGFLTPAQALLYEHVRSAGLDATDRARLDGLVASLLREAGHDA